uniref:Uncharacterized protein n=1 Tax=Lactuca sativa TaxID=4236 RepID=A0A9R1VTA9_LACSA|nr:hypothetical protein LSAT_V11C400210200 [Lactuca sativa]
MVKHCFDPNVLGCHNLEVILIMKLTIDSTHTSLKRKHPHIITPWKIHLLLSSGQFTSSWAYWFSSIHWSNNLEWHVINLGQIQHNATLMALIQEILYWKHRVGRSNVLMSCILSIMHFGILYCSLMLRMDFEYIYYIMVLKIQNQMDE